MARSNKDRNAGAAHDSVYKQGLKAEAHRHLRNSDRRYERNGEEDDRRVGMADPWNCD